MSFIKISENTIHSGRLIGTGLLIGLLLACGGGGSDDGGGSDTTDNTEPPADDTTPDAFSFTDQSNVAQNAVVESDAVTVEGINTPAAISVSDGEYAIDDGDYTDADATVSEGQSVTVRLTSSWELSTTTEATLTIGGVSATFSVTTSAVDETPRRPHLYSRRPPP